MDGNIELHNTIAQKLVFQCDSWGKLAGGIGGTLSKCCAVRVGRIPCVTVTGINIEDIAGVTVYIQVKIYSAVATVSIFHTYIVYIVTIAI